MSSSLELSCPSTFPPRLRVVAHHLVLSRLRQPAHSSSALTPSTSHHLPRFHLAPAKVGELVGKRRHEQDFEYRTAILAIKCNLLIVRICQNGVHVHTCGDGGLDDMLVVSCREAGLALKIQDLSLSLLLYPLVSALI